MNINKIYFEKYKSSDFNEYFNLVQDDDVMKYISGKGLTKEQANHKFNSILEKSSIDDDLGYFKVYTENQTLVGECKLVQNNYHENSLELGYILKKNFWQQGIGSQICKHLLSVSKDKFPTYEVIALINPDNVASRKLLEKFNFVSYWKGFENELFTEKFILKKNKTMQVKNITKIIEEIAPLTYAEDFDNVGLLVGDYSNDVTGVLVTLDTTEKVVEEAIANNCNLIISFHPIIFSGLKKLNGKNYVEKAVLKAIKNDINIYATHTALDNSNVGVNYKIAEQLKLINTTILIPKDHTLKQLITYVPTENLDTLKTVLYQAGAGKIGNYDSCGFSAEGKGNFRPLEGSNPFIGKKGKLETVSESRIEVTIPQHLEDKIMKALLDNHPYEEVAYSVIKLSNKNKYVGIGVIGELEKEMSEKDFFDYLKLQMNTSTIRHSKLLNKKIKKVAVLGGSGAFAIQNAKNAGADIYITADLKYHDFFSAENKIILADIGHFESEQFTKNLITSYLKEKFTNFVIFNSGINTNPVNYY